MKNIQGTNIEGALSVKTMIINVIINNQGYDCEDI